MKSLDQISLTGAYAANRCSKLQNKSKFRGSILGILGELMDFASSVPDIRRAGKGNIRHRLADIIMLMMLGRASGHARRSEIIEFGRNNLNRFRKMVILGNGMTSKATLRRVEQRIDDLSMADRKWEFAETYHARLLNEIICVDGKAERGTVMENGSSQDIISAYPPPQASRWPQSRATRRATR